MSYPGIETEELLGASHVRLTWYAVPLPVPLKLTVVIGFATDVLTIVSVPVARPAVAGSNETWIVAACPAIKMRGEAPPESENPAPCTVARLTVTGKTPEDDKVTDCVAGVFRATSPKFKLFALTVSDGAPVFN